MGVHCEVCTRSTDLYRLPFQVHEAGIAPHHMGVTHIFFWLVSVHLISKTNAFNGL